MIEKKQKRLNLKCWPKFYKFCAEKLCGLPVSGTIIEQKVLNLNRKLSEGEPNFIASQGWLGRWEKTKCASTNSSLR